ncbi:MAG: hypothetical protein HY720_18120 [Planctomycetes bacterium]|nr:hypothetical protein [Planctomycetota bacterium]
MIKINLLPQELVKSDRTPMSLFLVIIADVVLGMAAIVGFVYFHFIALKNAEEMRTNSEEDAKRFKAYGEEHTQVTAVKTKYEARNKQIQDLERTRLSWSRKLHEFAGVLEGEGEKKHPVWIDNWEPTAVERITGTQSGPSFDVKMTVHVARPAGAPQERVIENYLTDFRGDLTKTEDSRPEDRDYPFWSDFLHPGVGITFPGFKPEATTFLNYEEREFVGGEVIMKMKTLDWRYQEAEAAKKDAAAGAGAKPPAGSGGGTGSGR